MGLRNSSLYWAFHNMTIKSDGLWDTGWKKSPSSLVILLPLMVAPPPHRKAYVELKFPGRLEFYLHSHFTVGIIVDFKE